MVEMFRYLTGILDEKERRTCKIYAALSLISPVVDVFSFSVLIYIINRAIRANQASKGLIGFTLFMIAISLLKCLFELYKNKISNRFIYDGAQKLSMKIYEALIKEDLMEHNGKSAMQALTMVRHDTTSCIQIIVGCIGILVNGIALAGYAVLLIYVSRWTGVASSAGLALLMWWIFTRTRTQMIAYGEKSRECSIKASAQISIAYGSFKEMKIDDRSSLVMGKYRDASNKYAQIQGEFKYRSDRIGVILQNSIMAAMFTALAIILSARTNLAAALAPMVVYVTALVRMLPMSYNVIYGLRNVEFARKPYLALKDCMARYDEMKAEEKRKEALRVKNLTLQKGISVQNLTFGYRDNMNIFEDASIEIPVGCCIAIIGVSGSGKTTFVDLLLGLLRPQGGHVFFDDYDIVTGTDSEGPCRVDMGVVASYIPQTVFLNGETVRNNVAFFEDEEIIDDARVEECLKCAQIWEDVQQLPDGVRTLIGENGTAISGGQRQRIALARALYKDFSILVMDEATAALDMETEKAVIDSIRQIRGKKTLLMVTHHMSLANECDVVYRIEDRKILRVK